MRERTAPTRGISLRQLLSDAEFIGADDVRVSGCTHDALQCRQGDLFVALGDSPHDCRAQVALATQRGAAAVMLSRPVPDCRLPVCFVDDARSAYGRLCQSLVGNPSRQLKVVGIGGASGKTTTSYLVASVLQVAGYECGVLGTLGYFDGINLGAADSTTPPPPVSSRWLAAMLANGCSHAVMEVSDEALAARCTSGIDLDVACLTNIEQLQLGGGNMPTADSAVATQLFEHLQPEGFAVVNADDAQAASLLERLDGPVLSVGIDCCAELTATPLECCPSEQTFLLSSGDETVPVRSPLIGRHNIANCLMAAAVGSIYGIDLATVVRGIESLKRVPGRLERIECGQSFGVFVDHAHTPAALRGTLSALRAATSGRLICVFGARGDGDRGKRPWMGRTVESLADLAVITSDNPRDEDPMAIVRQIRQGFRQPESARVVTNRVEAIAWALAQAQPGDCVLIAGKGHEDYQMIGTDRLPCDDREIARQWLHESLPAQWFVRASA